MYKRQVQTILWNVRQILIYTTKTSNIIIAEEIYSLFNVYIYIIYVCIYTRARAHTHTHTCMYVCVYSICTVSYTHLDVYKRQTQILASFTEIKYSYISNTISHRVETTLITKACSEIIIKQEQYEHKARACLFVLLNCNSNFQSFLLLLSQNKINKFLLRLLHRFFQLKFDRITSGPSEYEVAMNWRTMKFLVFFYYKRISIILWYLQSLN